MIQANNVTVQFGGRVLFERVNVTFSAGNCYGISAQTALVNQRF